MHLLTICIPSLGIACSNLFLIFWLDWLSLYCWVLRVPYIFWKGDISDIWVTDIFSHVGGCLISFLFLMVSFDSQKFLFPWSQIYFVFFFGGGVIVACVLNVISKNPLPNPKPQRFRLILSSKTSIIWGLTFKSLIYINYLSDMK